MGSLDKKIARNEETAWRVIEGEALLVNPRTSALFPLDSVGTRIWELLDGTRTGTDIARILEDEYAQDLAQIESDLSSFIDDLAENNLVRVCG